MPRKKALKPPPDPFRWFDSSPEMIRLVVMIYVKYPLSLRNFEDLLHERGIDICHETVRPWWRRFGPRFGGIMAYADPGVFASLSNVGLALKLFALIGSVAGRTGRRAAAV